MKVTAMEEIRNVSCSDICTDGSCTYPIPANVRTDEHCNHAWKSEDGGVLVQGRRNLILTCCPKMVRFETTCDALGELYENTVTYRAIKPIPGTIKVVTPSGFNTIPRHNTTVTPLVNGTTSGPNTTVTPSGIQIGLPIILVVIGLFIMYSLKRFCSKRAKGPEP